MYVLSTDSTTFPIFLKATESARPTAQGHLVSHSPSAACVYVFVHEFECIILPVTYRQPGMRFPWAAARNTNELALHLNVHAS